MERRKVAGNLFKTGDKADPGDYQGIMLLSTVDKTFCKILNDRMETMLEKDEEISERQAEFNYAKPLLRRPGVHIR